MAIIRLFHKKNNNVGVTFTMEKKDILLITLLTIITNLFIYLIPLDSIFVQLRWGVGIIFSLFIPGYIFSKVLLKWYKTNAIEIFTISVALSMGILTLIGLLINFLFNSLDTNMLMLFLDVFIFLNIMIILYTNKEVIK